MSIDKGIDITVVGGGLGGLTAAIACAEQGLSVQLHEAHRTLGGRARSTPGPFVANDGTHVWYSDGEPYRWLAERRLVQPCSAPTVGELLRFRFRHGGRIRARPPAALLRMIARRRLAAPVDEPFGDWAGRRFGPVAARAGAGLVGVITYTADPGRLSAAFVWERLLRATAPGWPAVRYVHGGWQAMVERMAAHARQVGVRIATGERVDALPAGPVIVATGLDAARTLLGDDGLRWPSGRAALVDLGLRAHRRDPFVVSDLDEGGFLERYSLPDPSLAPDGHALVQIELPARDDEPIPDATVRAEALADLALPGWRDRVAWRRDAFANRRTGAVDPPGATWRDRPAIGRGGGVWLAGDSVAAPGMLAEVAVNSARTAAAAAVAAVRTAAAAR
ncbi:FAD-dependent oxidoreductase [Dactylosporangium sp. AC04546]|uniref:FAD-dependent oxidoreductase n=1 Tax=Dactylosporangium sp. AC04546 TaxID=2862460 RepID=UPI001EE0200E|nr:FAD-dependent oxidoreductase [Dactylosporangium sp. AC04546]WVK79974.1 FAD-dependent oxidoreductase [Dactylosporangium sp. AC04546]